MITGDFEHTAIAVAKNVGMADSKPILLLKTRTPMRSQSKLVSPLSPTSSGLGSAVQDNLHASSSTGQLHASSGRTQLHAVSSSGQLHAGSGTGQLHAGSGRAQLHAVSSSGQLHAGSGRGQLHAISNTGQLHASSSTGQLHASSSTGQLHSPAMSLTAIRQDTLDGSRTTGSAPEGSAALQHAPPTGPHPHLDSRPSTRKRVEFGSAEQSRQSSAICAVQHKPGEVMKQLSLRRPSSLKRRSEQADINGQQPLLLAITHPAADSLSFVDISTGQESDISHALLALAEGWMQCAVTGNSFEQLLQQSDVSVLELVMRSRIVFARMQPYQKGQVMDLLGMRGIHQMFQGQPRHIQVHSSRGIQTAYHTWHFKVVVIATTITSTRGSIPGWTNHVPPNSAWLTTSHPLLAHLLAAITEPTCATCLLFQ